MTSRTLAVASNNPHKLREIAAILAPFGLGVVGLDNWPELGDLPETGDTFEANALMKARALHLHTGLLTVADDSGLEVDSLGGLPGVHSKRFTPEGTAVSNNEELLRKLEHETNRTARFRCVVACVDRDLEITLEGRCEGKIGRIGRGRNGFGYDPLFLPDDRPPHTLAELTDEDKNTISHRGRAFRQLPLLLAVRG